MTGDHFLAVAGKLAAMSGGDAAMVRTSISRSYYGAFHLVLAFLHELQVPNIGREHNLDVQLYESGHSTARQVSRLLQGLYEDRRKADYRLDLPEADDIERARNCVAQAHQVRSLLDECRVEPARTQIQKNLVAWKVKTRRL